MTNAQSNRGIKSPSSKSPRSLLDKHRLFHRINGDRELKDSACRVAGYLMWRMNCRHETCWPGRQTIADALGMSLRTVGEALRSLKDRGWIDWDERRKPDGSPTSSVYTFVWDRADEYDNGYVGASDDRQDPAEAGKICQGVQAKSASRIEGRVTGEDSSQDSSPSAQSPGGEGQSKASRPTPSRTGDATTDAIWQKQLPELIEAHNVARRGLKERPESGGQLRGRTGKLIKEHGAPAVWKAFDTTIKAQPGGCPFDYATKLLAEHHSEEDKARALLYAPIEYR